jgi:hypothetical protein
LNVSGNNLKMRIINGKGQKRLIDTITLNASFLKSDGA